MIQLWLGEPDLEFAWVGDDAIEPLQQAQTLNILVGAGIRRSPKRARIWGWRRRGSLRRGSASTIPTTTNGTLATANDALEPGAQAAKTPKGAQVAANDDPRTKSDAGGATVVAAGPTEEEPKLDSEDESEGGTYFDPATGRVVTLPSGSLVGPSRGWINLRDLPQGPTYLSAPESDEPPGTVAEAIAPNGVLPGASDRGPRMTAHDARVRRSEPRGVGILTRRTTDRCLFRSTRRKTFRLAASSHCCQTELNYFSSRWASRFSNSRHNGERQHQRP